MSRAGTNNKKRRAAAKKADNKIKSKDWSESKAKAVRESQRSNKKTKPNNAKKSTVIMKEKAEAKKPTATTKKEQVKMPPTKQPTSAASSSSSDTESGAECWSTDAFAPSEWDDPDLTRSAKEHRENLRAARKVHSSRPMLLSRRLSWKIHNGGLHSPLHTPLAACRLTFAPSKCVILEIRRAH
jgi:hypothetical protein